MEELGRVTRDLEDFTQAISHDLKILLRSIQAYNTLLIEDYSNSLDDRGQEYLEKVRRAAERMNMLINELLTFCRVERKTEVEKVDLNELVAEIKEDLSARIAERGGEVVAGMLPTISTQRFWMKELLTNLVDNGLKFNKSDRPKVEICCEEGEKSYLFRVNDNGIGIEERYLNRIFNLVERLHPHEYEGTGAGLSICKRIIDKIGGKIWVESKLGEGSAFYFFIPKI